MDGLSCLNIMARICERGIYSKEINRGSTYLILSHRGQQRTSYLWLPGYTWDFWHMSLSSDQLRAAPLIGRNTVTWSSALSTDRHFTTIYHLTFSRNVKCQMIVIWHFHVTWKCQMIGFARWRFNLFECRRRMLQRHLPNGVEWTQLRSPGCW